MKPHISSHSIPHTQHSIPHTQIGEISTTIYFHLWTSTLKTHPLTHDSETTSLNWLRWHISYMRAVKKAACDSPYSTNTWKTCFIKKKKNTPTHPPNALIFLTMWSEIGERIYYQMRKHRCSWVPKSFSFSTQFQEGVGSRWGQGGRRRRFWGQLCW